ncbi:hsp90 co-chaperone Cdc37-like [Cimex lectularius]|uniref:Hsp90 co-chaperone Cdc37 n=1 Tax=Cimex lectularius TaxID=79782 RepID=A0A8I6THH1_CIMLE|nr:hsp90 co-chaperone Cdc37-like [Cimex lectularius]
MVDYSKWRKIEISDDEDETHPSIESSALFDYKHQARIRRMEEAQKEKDDLAKAKTDNQNKIKELKMKLTDGSGEGDTSVERSLLEELEKTAETFDQIEERLKNKERLTPWNIDTISQPGYTKTLIKRNSPTKPPTLTEEEREKRLQDFIKKNEKTLQQYGTLRSYDESQQFLEDHPHLVCEDTANYLVIWCVNLELQEKAKLSKLVAHQCICMQYILELAKRLDADPRNCVTTFFSKIKICDGCYKSNFEDELRSFIERVKESAREKLEIAAKEQEEEDRQARLGPGGLDPVEVFDNLPQNMKTCFLKQDVAMLQKAIADMPQDEVAYHMKRCVDAGLWVSGEEDFEKIKPSVDTSTSSSSVPK